MTVVPYYPLGDEVLKKIIRLQLGQDRPAAEGEPPGRVRLRRRLSSTTIASRCKEVETGARNVDHILTGTLLPEISRELLSPDGRGKGRSAGSRIDLAENGNFRYQFD